MRASTQSAKGLLLQKKKKNLEKTSKASPAVSVLRELNNLRFLLLRGDGVRVDDNAARNKVIVGVLVVLQLAVGQDAEVLPCDGSETHEQVEEESGEVLRHPEKVHALRKVGTHGCLENIDPKVMNRHAVDGAAYGGDEILDIVVDEINYTVHSGSVKPDAGAVVCDSVGEIV